MGYTIKVDNLNQIRSAFKNAPQVVAGQLEKSVKNAGAVILEREKREAPVRTGNLRRSIEMIYKPISISVTPKSAYSYFVHFGTGLFGDRKDLIRPKRAKVLAFKAGGKMIFAKYTKGQKPNAFVERTAQGVQPKINSIFDETLKNIIENI
jgi:HK97 gp10 family phage protein